MKSSVADIEIKATIKDRFPELMEQMPDQGWTWVKAAYLVYITQRSEPLVDFVQDLAGYFAQLKEISNNRERFRFSLAAKICCLFPNKIPLFLVNVS